MRTLPLLLLLLGGAHATAPADGAARRLAVYVQHMKRFKSGDRAETLGDLQGLLDDALLQRSAEPETMPACDLAALDVAAHGWLPRPEREALIAELRRPPSRTYGGAALEPPLAQLVSITGIAYLERLLDGPGGADVAHWLGAEVLARTREHGVERRRAACDLLFGRFIPETQAALFASARADDDALREAAFRALAGWNDPAVHRFVLRELERGRVSLPVALAHLRSVRDGLGTESAEILQRRITALFASPDWRDAVRAVRLCEVFDGMRAAPLLIDALALWNARIAAGDGTPRVQDEILAALRALSGRSIPPRPDRWRLWWKAVREGRVELPPEGDAPGAVTQASFFGLRPVTDGVLFVIDRSRSMTARFGTTGMTRYEMAVEELCGFATKLGPEARFGVTLFHSAAERWRPKLTGADENGVKAARAWLRGKVPDGGTLLFGGIALALDLERDGGIGAGGVEADTVIVLCDGDTGEGPYWVGPWLERVNEGAQLVFHCVQIGGGGDGTLERLAAGSGGVFVRLEG